MHADKTLDVCGLQCPLPLLKTKKILQDMPVGSILCVIATDPASQRDIRTFVELSTHEWLDSKIDDNRYFYWLKKG